MKEFDITIIEYPDMGVICTHEVVYIVKNLCVAIAVMRDQFQLELIIF